MKYELKLGENKGNYFTLIIRNINEDNSIINDAIEKIKNNGFINYYGLQRFGTSEIPSYLIGKYIIKDDFENAIKLLLKPVESGNTDANKAKTLYTETGNAKDALELLPDLPSYYIEKRILQGLIDFPNGFQNAFDKLSTKSKTLYLHAVQSYIWNSFASFRLEKFPHNIISGDLILVDVYLLFSE